MCGVIAYWSDDPQPAHREILKNLFVESKIRGLHAFGFATTGPQCYHKWASRKSATLMGVLDDLDNEDSFNGLIGHTRYSTSGDFNEMKNNQPINYGKTVVVLNGVISMKPKVEYERDFGGKFYTENDAEVFAWMTDEMDQSPAKLERWKQLLLGHYSIAAAWIKNGRVYVVRNHRRPLWITYHQGASFVASTNDILKRSGLPKGVLLPERSVYQLLPSAT